MHIGRHNPPKLRHPSQMQEQLLTHLKKGKKPESELKFPSPMVYVPRIDQFGFECTHLHNPSTMETPTRILHIFGGGGVYKK